MGGNDPYKVVHHRLQRYGIPNVLFIGTSHVERLKTFAKNSNTPPKYNRLLSNSYYMGVGGSKWWNLAKYLNGEDLPENKEYLSDQWLEYHSTKFHPHFVTIVCGGNDADDMNSALLDLWESDISLAEKRVQSGILMKTWYDALTPCINEFFEELMQHIPGCVIRYTPILQRPYWQQRARHFARWLDHYVLAKIGKTFGIKESPVRKLYKLPTLVRPKACFVDDMMPGFLNSDDVHLSTWGNRLFVMCAMMPILHKWLHYFETSPALRDPKAFWDGSMKFD